MWLGGEVQPAGIIIGHISHSTSDQELKRKDPIRTMINTYIPIELHD